MQRKFPVLQNKHAAPLLEKDLTDKVIGAAIEVHRALGPGLLESAYQLCLAQECKLQKLPFEEQVPLKLNYKGIELDGGYRIDFVFDKRVVVELKAVEKVLPVHEAQLLTYWPVAQLQHSRFERRYLSPSTLTLKTPCLSASVVKSLRKTHE